jgi:hypothetical protein
VPSVVEGDEEATRVAARAVRPGRALKCPSWIFVANRLGRERFEAIVFLQRDVRDQVASLVEMMAGTTNVDWERPESVWRGAHGAWVASIAPSLGIDVTQPLPALADLWCAYTRAAFGVPRIEYERVVSSVDYFGEQLRRLGVRASEPELTALLATHSHGPGQCVRGVGRWRTDLPAEVAAQLVKRRDKQL